MAQRWSPSGESGTPNKTPREIDGLEVTNHLGQKVPLNLQFTDSDGNLVSLNRFFNRTAADGTSKKPVVLMMVYFRCPLLCPQVLDKFTRTLNDIDFTVGSDYDVVIVSFDGRDKPSDAAAHKAAQLMAYSRTTTDQIRDGFTFLTSTPETAQPLADALGFPYRYLPASGEFAHGAVVFVLSPDGTITRYLTGLLYPVRDVRLALLEAGRAGTPGTGNPAAAGSIGTVFDKFTLWCYHFDPSAGSYTLQAMRVMQVSGAVTIVLLALLVGAMFRFERNKKRRLAQAGPSGPTVQPGRAAGVGGGRGVVPGSPAISGHVR